MNRFLESVCWQKGISVSDYGVMFAELQTKEAKSYRRLEFFLYAGALAEATNRKEAFAIRKKKKKKGTSLYDSGESLEHAEAGGRFVCPPSTTCQKVQGERTAAQQRHSLSGITCVCPSPSTRRWISTCVGSHCRFLPLLFLLSSGVSAHLLQVFVLPPCRV